MFDLVGWLLSIPPLLSVPLNGEPTVVFVPTWVLNWVSLPEPDIAVGLDAPGRFSGILGRQLDVKQFQRLMPHGERQIVHVLVDLNRVPPNKVMSTVHSIMAGWNPKAKATIFVKTYRSQDVVPPDE